MQKIYLPIGLPGSGKSTWAIEKAKNDINTIIISKDNIREMIKGEYVFDNRLEPLVTKITLSAFAETIQNNNDIILDETNLTKKVRNFWINEAKNINEDCEIIYVIFPERNDLLERRMRKDRGYSKEKWKEVISKLKEIFQPISDEEQYDKIIYMKENND